MRIKRLTKPLIGMKVKITGKCCGGGKEDGYGATGIITKICKTKKFNNFQFTVTTKEKGLSELTCCVRCCTEIGKIANPKHFMDLYL